MAGLGFPVSLWLSRAMELNSSQWSMWNCCIFFNGLTDKNSSVLPHAFCGLENVALKVDRVTGVWEAWVPNYLIKRAMPRRSTCLEQLYEGQASVVLKPSYIQGVFQIVVQLTLTNKPIKWMKEGRAISKLLPDPRGAYNWKGKYLPNNKKGEQKPQVNVSYTCIK